MKKQQYILVTETVEDEACGFDSKTSKEHVKYREKLVLYQDLSEKIAC